MATQLTRCLCGKIYDSLASANCPSCGTILRVEPKAAQAEGAAAGTGQRVDASNPPITPKNLDGANGRKGDDKREIQVSLSIDFLVKAAVVLLVVGGGVVWLLRKPPVDETTGKSAKTELKTELKSEPKTDPKPGEGDGKTASNDKLPSPEPENNLPKTEPKPNPTPAPKPKTDPVATTDTERPPEPKLDPKTEPAADLSAPKNWLADAESSPGSQGADLAAIVTKAKDGDSITLKPGIYAGGFTVDRKLRITGETAEPGRFIINSKVQKNPVRITAAGVTFANLQILHPASATGPALVTENGSTLAMEGCELRCGTEFGIEGRSPAALSFTRCTFSSERGRVMLVRGPTKMTLNGCVFAGGDTAIAVDGETRVEMQECRFEGIGGKETKDAALRVLGADASVAATGCTFTGCRLPLSVEKEATLTLTKCTLTGNGVRGDKGDFTQGIVAVGEKGSLIAKDTTFEKDLQGINVAPGGSAELQDCRFIDCGIETKNENFDTFSAALRVSGRAALRHCTFSRSVWSTIYLHKGGSLSAEDSEFSGTKFTAVLAGPAQGQPGKVELRKSRFVGNGCGVWLRGGVEAGITDCEFQQNVLAVSAREAGTRVTLSGGTIAGSATMGLYVFLGADAMVKGTRFEANGNAVQLGNPGKPEEKASATIEEAKFAGNTEADVFVNVQSRVTLRACEFGPDGAKVSRAAGGEVESDPPITGIVEVGKKGAPSGGSTASNNKGSSSKRPAPVRRPPPADPVREILRAVDQVRRIFR